ncbi:hypothetical protein KM043_002670 [Ampulex compressa]|nr:hypothetical protein KM043_002670 [Ampulex compressa]
MTPPSLRLGSWPPSKGLAKSPAGIVVVSSCLPSRRSNKAKKLEEGRQSGMTRRRWDCLSNSWRTRWERSKLPSFSTSVTQRGDVSGVKDVSSNFHSELSRKTRH